MATVPAEITRLMSNARNHVPGALDAALKLELFNVFDELMQKTNIWQEDITYSTAVGRTDYDLAGDEPGTIIRLLSNVDINDTDIVAFMPTMGTLSLHDAPTIVQRLTATVALTVIDPTDPNGYPEIPEGLVQKYYAGILAGVVSRMMMQPAKPYTNQQLAIFHGRTFAAAVSTARTEVLHANRHGAQRWSFPKFAGGSQR